MGDIVNALFKNKGSVFTILAGIVLNNPELLPRLIVRLIIVLYVVGVLKSSFLGV